MFYLFEHANPGVTLEPWGLEEFRAVFRKLNLDDLQSWFGYAPTEETKTHLGFKDLQVVLESLARPSLSAVGEGKDVPMGKIQANALSESVTTLLKAGMSKAS